MAYLHTQTYVHSVTRYHHGVLHVMSNDSAEIIYFMLFMLDEKFDEYIIFISGFVSGINYLFPVLT